MRLSSFLSANNTLHPRQHGFHSGYSTDSALHPFIAKIISAWENKEFIISTYMDLAKAFDGLDHGILLQKLPLNGIIGPALNWIDSYHSNRMQQVKIGNKISSPLPMTTGIPQGSIVGLILFLLYVNNIFLLTDNHPAFLSLYADDSTCLVSSRSLELAIS